MQQDPVVKSTTSKFNWPWLAALGTFGLLALAGGKLVLAAGFLFLSFFAFYNNPLRLNETIPTKPGNLLIFSWACGLAGVIAVAWAAFAS